MCALLEIHGLYKVINAVLSWVAFKLGNLQVFVVEIMEQHRYGAQTLKRR
jgi:hypothetical protein